MLETRSFFVGPSFALDLGFLRCCGRPGEKNRAAQTCTVEDIREPDRHILRLNPAAETIYGIQLGSDFDSRMWAKESELEVTECQNQPLRNCN